MIVITAVTSQAAISNAGEPSPRDISAETIKMPDPIIEPITIAVAENNPMLCTNCGADDPGTLCSPGPEEISTGVFFKRFTFVSSTVKPLRKSPSLSKLLVVFPKKMPTPRDGHLVFTKRIVAYLFFRYRAIRLLVEV